MAKTKHRGHGRLSAHGRGFSKRSIVNKRYMLAHRHQDPSIPIALLGIVVSLFVAYSVSLSLLQPTAYVVSGGEEYSLEQGSANSATDSSSTDNSATVAYTDQPVGESSSSDYNVVFGPLPSGDTSPPTQQNTTQDKTLPDVGEAVTFSVEWEDDSGL